MAESDTQETLDKIDISDLRRIAKLFGIKAERSWSTEDYVLAIKQLQEQGSADTVVDANAPKPGYVRIELYKDLSPGHKNLSVPVGFNGNFIHIPRGIPVDIPKEFVSVLQDSRYKVFEKKEDDSGKEHYIEVEKLSYPFQIIASTPGQAPLAHDSRHAQAKELQKFVDKFGHWPTMGEFNEWKKKTIMTA